MTFLEQTLAAATAGDTIELRSNLTPPMTWRAEDLFAKGGGPSPLLALLRPVVTIRDSDGAVLAMVAPGGDAPEWVWMAVAAGVALLVLWCVLAFG